MNKLLCFLLSMVIPIIIYSQDTQSKWINTPLRIDGNNSDWGERPRMFDSNTKMFYEIKNDDDNLYAIFEIIDKKSQIKFMQAGFQMHFKIKSKPKLKASIEFLSQELNHRNKENIQQEYLLKSSYAEIEGFLQTTSIIKKNSKKQDPFTFDIGWAENKNMLIEVKIPLHELFDSTYKIEKILQTPINLSCTLNALEHSSSDAMHSSDKMQGKRSSGGINLGMKPGGEKPGRGNKHHEEAPGSNSQEMQALFSEQSFKTKIILSKKF